MEISKFFEEGEITVSCQLKRLFSIIMVLIIISGCIVFPMASESGEDACIIFTHDMHSHLEPVYEENSGVKTQYGGFARVKTIIDEVKQRYPYALTVDGGDFSMGTLFQTIYTTEAPELTLMGEMGYDYITLGNHEFDYGGFAFADMIKAASENSKKPALTIANTDFSGTLTEEQSYVKDALDEYGFQDYFITEKDGVKIAVFGLIGKDAQEYSPASGLVFSDMIKTAKKLVKEIKDTDDPDLIICLSHSGTSESEKDSEDENLAKAVPDIDVIVSGHTHTKLNEPIKVGNTTIVSCGEYAKYVGLLKLSRDSGGRWSSEEYKNIAVDATVAEDEQINSLVQMNKINVTNTFLSRYGYSFDEVLAYSPFSFTPIEKFGKSLEEDELGNLIADSYVYAVREAEKEQYVPIAVAIVPNGLIRNSIISGDVTVSEIFDICPLGIGNDGISGYPLVSVYVTGKELKAIAEIDASVSTLMSTAQLYMSGLSYEYNPNRLIFNRVTNVKLQLDNDMTVDINNDDLYRVVTGLYTAEMFSLVKSKSMGLINIEPKHSDGTPIEEFKSEILYNQNGEIKEWTSIAQFVSSFEKRDEVSMIPYYYNELQDRKIKNDKTNWFEFFKQPNKASVIIMSVLILLIVLFIIAIKLIIKFTKKLIIRIRNRKA